MIIQKFYVGCICAEHIEEDYVGPRRREQQLRSRNRRLRRWCEGDDWRVSALGNRYLNVDGYNIVLFRTDQYDWRIRVCGS
jgi:hypothetical protein